MREEPEGTAPVIVVTQTATGASAHPVASRRDRTESPSVLDRLSPAARSTWARLAREVEVSAGGSVLVEGGPGDSVYVIRSGVVDIVGDRRHGPLAVLGPGDLLGEQSLLSSHPRSATAVARTDAVLLRLSRADFELLLQGEPDVATAVAAVLSERVRTTSRLAAGRGGGVVVAIEPRTGYRSGTHTGATGGPGSVGKVVRAACDRLAASCRALGFDALVLPPSASAGEAAVRAARDHQVVVVPLDRVPGDTAAPVMRAVADWRVVLLDRGGTGGGRPLDFETHRRIAYMTADPADTDRVARLVCRRRVGVALGSGSIRGFAHGGVLQVLKDSGLPVDLLSGSSAGAIAGALFLTGSDPSRFADLRLAAMEALRTGLPGLPGVPRGGLLSGRRLRSYLRRALGAETTFADLPIPFVVAATDLDAHRSVHLDSGPLADAVAASAAVPGVFPPVTVGGHRLADGGTTDPVPVAALRARGADVVVAVDVMGISNGVLGARAPRLRLPIPALLENLFIGLDTITAQLALTSCLRADIVVRPHAPATPWYEPVPARSFEAAGARAMTDALPQLAELLSGAR